MRQLRSQPRCRCFKQEFTFTAEDSQFDCHKNQRYDMVFNEIFSMAMHIRHVEEADDWLLVSENSADGSMQDPLDDVE